MTRPSRNVPGPGAALCLGRSALFEIFTVVPWVGNLNVAVARSYTGQFNLTISDPASGTDVEVLARGVSDSKWWKHFAELPSLCGVGVRHDDRHLTNGKAFVHPAGCAMGDAGIWHRWGFEALIRVRLSS
jgi:hypothetical protein